jgi:hypothetical protein
MYFELREACDAGGCPICSLATDVVKRYLEAVLYEGVNDPETRDGVVAARGYCNVHSWLLREIGAGLGAALLYRDVLRHVAVDLDRIQPGEAFALLPEVEARARASRRVVGLMRRRSGAGLVHSDPHSTCPACRERDHFESLAIAALASYLSDDELRAAFERSGGLCLVHLDRSRHAVRDRRQLADLLSLQRDLYLRLVGELDEYIRKQDYRFSAEPLGSERDAWIRSIEKVAGRLGIR